MEGLESRLKSLEVLRAALPIVEIRSRAWRLMAASPLMCSRQT